MLRGLGGWPPVTFHFTTCALLTRARYLIWTRAARRRDNVGRTGCTRPACSCCWSKALTGCCWSCMQ